MVNINTNLISLMVQRSLTESTKSLNKAIEQMATGLKLNHSSDNAANYFIVKDMTTKIDSYVVAEDNVAMGLDMIATATDSLDLIGDKLTRLRALQEQASNGTYGPRSLEAINIEVNSIIDEIERIYDITEYNGIKLFGDLNDPTVSVDLSIQAGLDASNFSVIDTTTSLTLTDLQTLRDIGNDTSASAISAFFTTLDNLILDVATKQSEMGATQNRLEGALEEISTQSVNLISSRSTLRDADISEVSSEYLCQQILQQASSTLLSAANQTPSIALGLI